MTTFTTTKAIHEAAAVGALCASMSRWARGKRVSATLLAKSCNAVSPPFQHMVGCTNTPSFSWRDTRACARCAALSMSSRYHNHAAHQLLLRHLQDDAGIADYRTWRPRMAVAVARAGRKLQ